MKCQHCGKSITQRSDVREILSNVGKWVTPHPVFGGWPFCEGNDGGDHEPAKVTKFYYAITDEMGVLCVDQLNGGGEYGAEYTEEKTAALAEQYPNAIYFGVTRTQ